MTIQFSVDAWERHADYVLPVLIGEDGDSRNREHFWQLQQSPVFARHFPPGDARETFKAITALILEDKPVHITTLQERLDSVVSTERLHQWFAMWTSNSTLTGDVFGANLETLHKLGEASTAMEVLQEGANRISLGEDVEVVKGSTISSLIRVGEGKIESETGAKMGNDFEAYMSEEPTSHMMTGVEIMDAWTGGISPGDLLLIAAPMKQRKTTLALNMVLNMVECGTSCAVFMLESNKRMVAAMLVSMLAQRWLIKNGHYGTKNDASTNRPVEEFGAKHLVRLQNRYRRWGELRVQAVDEGIRQFRAMDDRLRIYDKSHSGGALSDMASIQRVMLRDKALYDTEFAVIDHAQRINEKGSDYEKLTQIAPFVETMARREEIAICLLAQLKVAEAEGTGNTHNAGIRGGTVLEEAADYTFITGYRQKMPDSEQRYPADKMIIGLHESRYGDGGSHMRALVKIDPNSGFIRGGGRGDRIPYEEMFS